MHGASPSGTCVFVRAMMARPNSCIRTIDTLKFKPCLYCEALWGAGIKAGPCDADAPCRASIRESQHDRTRRDPGDTRKTSFHRTIHGLLETQEGVSMNKAELINAMADHADLSKADAGRALDAVTDQI